MTTASSSSFRAVPVRRGSGVFSGFRVFAALACIAAAPLAFAAVAAAQPKLTEAFLYELQENDLTFNEANLKDFASAPIVENEDMNFELAARSPSGLEVRYAIRRVDSGRDESMVAPESMGPAMFLATVLNVARDENDGVLSMTALPPEGVQHNFNAPSGAAALVIPSPTFAKGFDRCVVIAIEAKRVDAFMFYLYNSRNEDAAHVEIGRILTTLHFR